MYLSLILYIRVVRFLVNKYPLSPNDKDNKGYTPLSLAVMGGHME